jgi:YfiH family protein
MTTRAWALAADAGVGDNGAWAQVAAAMTVGAGGLVRANQVHGVGVLIRRACDPPVAALPEADIIVSSDPTTAIAIQTADCAPLLVADRRTNTVAAAHAGWRGLAAGVPRATIGALAREFGCRPEDLIAAIGPSIGACCYEVGPEVRDRFEEAGWSDRALSRWFFARAQPTSRNRSMARVQTAPAADRWYFDSGRAARDQLESAGVARDQIFLADLCTASHPDLLCSYRRDGAGAGRMAAAIRPRS